MNIVVTNDQHFTPEQKQRLESLGNTTFYDSLPNADEYLKRIKNADIICSGAAGLQDAYAQLKNVYITVAFVSVAFVDLDILRRNGVKISNAPGSNRHGVSEWIMWMMLTIARSFTDALNRTETYRITDAPPPLYPGLTDKNLTILGSGMIAKQLKQIAEAFGMHVSLFSRGDDLHESVQTADYVVDALSSNTSTQKLLDGSFFAAMKKGSSFLSITRSEVVDEEALIAALDSEHLHKAAMDCGGILVGDTDDPLYKRFLRHSKILVTPHTAYNSEMSGKLGSTIMIDNVEAWINGTPQNLLN